MSSLESTLNNIFEAAPNNDYFTWQLSDDSFRFNLFSAHGEQFALLIFGLENETADANKTLNNLANVLENNIYCYEEYLDVLIEEKQYANTDEAWKDLEDIKRVTRELIEYFQAKANELEAPAR